MTDASTK